MSATIPAAATDVPVDRSNSRKAFSAGFLAWTFDAFDFFILTYVIGQVARDFHQPIKNIAFTLTASLLMRPVGAFIFGLLADRYGRRIPLMLVILFYSAVEVASGFATTYHTFLILRFLYGIGMGGVWGVGASLALESASAKSRGMLSGILQEGYALGNLLAALTFWTVFPHWGWRPMFFIGVIPAMITLVIVAQVKESDAWKLAAAKHKGWPDYFRELGANWKRFLYLVAIHGHDEFPVARHAGSVCHLSSARPALPPRIAAILSVISMVGAIVGGTLFGMFSDRVGSRKAMVRACFGGIFVIPLWVFLQALLLPPSAPFLCSSWCRARGALSRRTSTNFPPIACVAFCPASPIRSAC